MNLKKLQKQWYSRLKREGFADIEYTGGALKKDGSKNTRGWHDQDSIRDYYSWVSEVYCIRKLDTISKRVLPLYMQGIHLVVIANKLRLTYSQVRYVARKARLAYKAYCCGMSSP